MSEPSSAVGCARHPDRVGGVACQRCGNAMCPDCMHQASVGWHCTECVTTHRRQTAPVAKAVRVALDGHPPLLTKAIIIAAAGVFLWDMSQGVNLMTGSGSTASRNFGLFAPYVDNGEWYRVATSAFTHSGLMHIGFNMWLLWMIGRSLEGRFGHITFGLMYVAGILGGALGAMLLEPRSAVVGASGAVFALMGITLVLQRMNGINVFESGIGGLVLLNVLLSFRGGISLGGHLGGLAVGLAMGWIIGTLQSNRGRRRELVPMALAAVGLVCLIGLIPVINRAVASF